MDEDQIEGCVSVYLKDKGFTLKTEEHLQHSNSNNNDSSFKPNNLERSTASYHDGYGRLRTWAYRSLDPYKHELLRVLYPVFIHCFMDLVEKGNLQEARSFFNTYREDHEMMHLRDLQKLEAVLSPIHLQEMEFAHSLRQSKFNIKICEYSYELLLQHLHSTRSTTIIGIMNEHISFQVTTGPPSSISDDPEGVTLSGSIRGVANQIYQKEILWGLLEDSVEDRIEKAGALLPDTEKGEGEAKEGENDESNKKRSTDGGKQGGSIRKVKREKTGSATGKGAKLEANSVPAAPRVKLEHPLPTVSTEVELSILEDLRNRVQLNSVALPSVNFYTFINTHDGLSCSSISDDGSLVAGGFSDSSLKVWDVAKLEQQPTSSFSQGGNGTSQSEQIIGQNGGKRNYMFQGHSGPVYAATFSPFGDFILSSSADKTIRLWNTKLNASIVCYKGHNYPVWDVQFSPAGHCFASSSHDRTARIWSMDRLQPLRIMAGHLSDVDCVQWHPNCNYIATGSSDKTVRLWDVQSGECVRVFIGHRSMILSLAMSPDGRYMASGDEDGTIMTWDLSSGSCVTPLIGHSSCVWSLAYSCEGSLLASGSADCTVKFWDVNTGTKFPRNEEKSGNINRLRSLKSFPTKSTSVYSLQFSRRNLLFAAGGLTKSLQKYQNQVAIPLGGLN